MNSNHIYDKAFAEHGNSIKSVLMGNPQRQYLRFAELIKNVDMNDPSKTILDIGSGTGELYKFLNFMGYRGIYLGVDINENLVKVSKERFPKAMFIQHNILEKSGTVFNADYVLMSGLFNVDFGQDMEWIKQFIRAMVLNCKRFVSFNAISTHVNHKEESMFYIDPSELFNFCLSLSKRVSIYHHNIPYNFTVQIFTDQDFNTDI